MTSSTPSNISEWVALVDATEETRSAEMKRRYAELAGLSEEERVKQLTEMARGEYELPEDKLHAFTKTRLLVWIDMDEEQVKKVAHSYDTAVEALPGTLAMRRVGPPRLAHSGRPPGTTGGASLLPRVQRPNPSGE